jgi:hypothetical protein
MLGRAVRLIATLMLSVLVVAAVAWAAMAIWFDGQYSRAVAAPMAAGLGILLAALVRPLLGAVTFFDPTTNLENSQSSAKVSHDHGARDLTAKVNCANYRSAVRVNCGAESGT